VLALTKSNLAELAPAHAYHLEPVDGVARVVWDGPSEHNASSLLADRLDGEPIDSRSPRDTHAARLSLAGCADKVFQRRMGDASPTATDRYVKAAETFGTERFGAPFPPLPDSVLSRLGIVQKKRRPPGKRRGVCGCAGRI
jgi:hypothetical protein